MLCKWDGDQFVRFLIDDVLDAIVCVSCCSHIQRSFDAIVGYFLVEFKGSIELGMEALPLPDGADVDAEGVCDCGVVGTVAGKATGDAGKLPMVDAWGAWWLACGLV
jgi:hypothetical protein